MEIKVNRKTLLDALRFGGMVAGKCKTIPILDDCKVVVKGNKMVVTSTDTEITVAKKVDIIACDVENGEFCIVPSDIINVLATLRDEEVSLEVNESVCTLVHSRGTAKVAVLPAIDFPSTSSGETKTSFSMDATRLRSWLDAAKSFVASDPLRPALTGMYLAIEGGEVWCASSDSHKLYMDGYKDIAFEGIETNVIVPNKAFGYASSILEGYACVTVQIDDNNVSFVVSDAKISARKIVGVFPKVRQILPKQNPINVEVNTADLASSISRMKLFADKVSKLVSMSFSEDGLKLTCSDLMSNKSCEDFCDVLAYDGRSIEICTKAENIEAIVSKVNSDTLMFGMSETNRPIVIYEADNPNKVLFTMPLAKISK
jgi:DNA polymerase-3 subunit beta